MARMVRGAGTVASAGFAAGGSRSADLRCKFMPTAYTYVVSLSRLPLTRDRILRAAAGCADQHGLEALTMRRLGQLLGVEAMSLYNHVANKDDLLDGMVDLVFGEIDLPPADVDWQTAMRQRALSVREVLVRHPWATSLMESRLSPGPATLRHHDAVLGTLRQAGFSLALAAHAFSAINSYIYGFALQQINLPFHSADEVADMATQFLRQF